MEYYYKLGMAVCIIIFLMFFKVAYKFNKQIKYFYKEEKMFSRGVVISLVVIALYNYTADWPEVFEYGNAVFTFLKDLSMAYLGGLVFYIIQAYIPRKRLDNKMKEHKIYYLCDILDTMNHLYVDIFSKYLKESYNLSNEEKTHSQFIKIESEFKLTHKVLIDCGETEITYQEYILNCIEKNEKYIDKIYVRIGSYLDDEINVLLLEITNSSLHNSFKFVDPEIPNNIYWGQLTRYYELYRKLHRYIEKNK